MMSERLSIVHLASLLVLGCGVPHAMAGKDGHPSFTANAAAWKAAFEQFLKEVGL